MTPSPRGFVPAPGFLRRHLQAIPQFHEEGQPELTTPPTRDGTRVHYEIKEYDPLLDSSNIDMEDWVRIAKDIEQHYPDYDAFIVLHGTDTMAYTASALSFMLENLDKPVLLTGSQIPLSSLRSDGVANLLGALTVAGHYPIPEVGLYFADTLYRGNRARKVDAGGFEAFASGNYLPLVDVGVDIAVHWRRVLPNPEGPLRLIPITNTHVAALRLFPGMTAKTLENFLRPPLEGLIIETYGSGNGPDQRADFLDTLRTGIERGVVIVNCTQCLHGGVTPDYATGTALGEVGVISGTDMTAEAALTKLAWLLSQDLDRATICERMQTNLRGELTTPDHWEDGLRRWG